MTTARHRLIWHTDSQMYELNEPGNEQLLPLANEEGRWLAWLENISSFSFQGQQGQLTVRKETRTRQSQYWYAYRRIGPKMMKRYLGRSPDLTLARLEKIAALFSSAQSSVTTPSDHLTTNGPHLHHEGESNEEQAAMQADTSSMLLTQSARSRDLLLATKLYRPRPRSRLVSRSHLTFRLQQGMESALTLVSAPAGCGKTTLLAQWLAKSEMPAAWLSLEPEDNEPVRFFSYAVAALQTLYPQLGKVAQALLEASSNPPLERVLTLLINDILENALSDFALVLDDYHVIETDAVHRAMEFLLEHLPPQMHLVLATRTDPPLPFTRLRANGQLNEMRASDLRFDLNEVHTFLHTVMGLDLPDAALATLESRTEGWIAGLQLVALSLQSKSDVPALLSTFRGGHRFIFDYLTEEVFSRQETPVQEFLLSTSILERLCDPLCAAVTGLQERQVKLDVLDSANLFVVALDDERHWYRYHHLFAEVLRTRLQQTHSSLLSHLHLRASRWYEQQGLYAEAVQHALTASDIERAADLIEHIDMNDWAGLGSHIQRMLVWLSHLPESLVSSRPFLCIIHAIALMFTNQLQEAESRLQIAERCLDAQGSSEYICFLRGTIATTRGLIALFSGNIAHSVAFSQQALDLLPHKEMTPGPISRLNVAQAFLVNGDVTPAQERLAQEMVLSLQTSSNQSMTMRSLTNLAQLQILQGRLRQAAVTFEQVARVSQGQENMQAIAGSPTFSFGLAEVLREWNELDKAEHLLKQGMELIEGGITVEGEIVTLGYTTKARLLMARGEYDAALAVLKTFECLASERSFAAHLIARGSAIRAHVQLASGSLKEAISWKTQCGISVKENDLNYTREQEYLTLARVLIVEGHNSSSPTLFQDIFHMLQRLLQDAEVKARRSSVLEILLLQSLSLATQGDRSAAFPLLTRALSIAEPEGYIRLFVDEGALMRDLLREARSRRITPAYVATLLTAFGDPMEEGSSSSDTALIEPLTRREREVLQLLGEGASNREIAQHLIVSTGTVKKYVYNICGKLGVQSRVQALVRARSLHLL